MKDIFWMIQNPIVLSLAMRILKVSSIIGFLILSLILAPACENPVDQEPTVQPPKPPVQREKTPLRGLSYSETNVIAEAGEAIADITPTLKPDGATAVYEVRSLPTGLELRENGIISGTPTTPAAEEIMVTVRASGSGEYTGSVIAEIRFTVNPAPGSIRTRRSLSGGISQVSYEAVQKGMTRAQIDTLIGITGSRRMDTPPTGGAVYVWQDSEHALKKSIQVWFTNDDKAEGLIFHDSTDADAVIHLANDFNATPARDFTRAAYESITGDMTLAQVNGILGFDGTVRFSGMSEGKPLTDYIWKASIFKDISVTFTDGKATSKVLTDRSVFPRILNYTPLPGGISQVSYEAVQKGMTRAQIDTLIGITGSRRMDTPPTGGAVYVWQDSEHALKKSIQVWFTKDDKAEGLIFHDSTDSADIIHLAKDFNSDPTRDFTRAAYESITGDMSLAEVNGILGFDGTLQITADIPAGTLTTYNWKASIFKDVTVNFIDGKAASKILTDRSVYPIDTDYTIF